MRPAAILASGVGIYVGVALFLGIVLQLLRPGSMVDQLPGFLASGIAATLVAAFEGRQQGVSALRGMKAAKPLPESEVSPGRVLLLAAAVYTVVITLLRVILGVVLGTTAALHGVSEVGPNAVAQWTNSPTIIPIHFVLTGPVTGLLVFFLGFWIGRRVSRFGRVTLAFAILGGRLLADMQDVLLGVAVFDSYPTSLGFREWQTLGPIALNFLLQIAIGLLGVRVGRRGREATYLAQLVGLLKPEDRRALADLAYEGAVGLRSQEAARTPPESARH